MKGALEAAGGVRRKGATQGQTRFSKLLLWVCSVMEPYCPLAQSLLPALGFLRLGFLLSSSDHRRAGSSCNCLPLNERELPGEGLIFSYLSKALSPMRLNSACWNLFPRRVASSGRARCNQGQWSAASGAGLCLRGSGSRAVFFIRLGNWQEGRAVSSF